MDDDDIDITITLTKELNVQLIALAMADDVGPEAYIECLLIEHLSQLDK